MQCGFKKWDKNTACFHANQKRIKLICVLLKVLRCESGRDDECGLLRAVNAVFEKLKTKKVFDAQVARQMKHDMCLSVLMMMNSVICERERESMAKALPSHIRKGSSR